MFKVFLVAQFYTWNLILFYFNGNIDKCRPSLANYSLFFCLKLQKLLYLRCVVKFQLRKFGCALTWYKHAVLQLQNCIALQLNQKAHCKSCAALQTLKKLNCAFCTALRLYWLKRSFRFVVLTSGSSVVRRLYLRGHIIGLSFVCHLCLISAINDITADDSNLSGTLIFNIVVSSTALY